MGHVAEIGYIYYPDSSESQEAAIQKPFSEETARTIDHEVKRIVQEAYQQCKTLLKEKRKELILVAEELLEKEELTRDDMVRILGPRQWEAKGDFDKWFGGGHPKGADEGRGKNAGGIGDSESGGGPGPKLPPGLARGPDEEVAPSLFQQFERMSREWKQL